MSKRGDSAVRWREMVRGQADSGLSVVAYCRQARVPAASFYAWRRKLRERGALSNTRRSIATFAEVRGTPTSASDVTKDAALAAGTLEVRLPGGRGIVVRPGFDPRTLLDLVATLEHGGGAVGRGEAGV